MTTVSTLVCVLVTLHWTACQVSHEPEPPFTCDIATEPLWDDDLHRYICVECEQGYFSISNDAEPCRACSVCSVFLQSRCSDQCPSVFLAIKPTSDKNTPGPDEEIVPEQQDVQYRPRPQDPTDVRPFDMGMLTPPDDDSLVDSAESWGGRGGGGRSQGTADGNSAGEGRPGQNSRGDFGRSDDDSVDYRRPGGRSNVPDEDEFPVMDYSNESSDEDPAFDLSDELEDNYIEEDMNKPKIQQDLGNSALGNPGVLTPGDIQNKRRSHDGIFNKDMKTIAISIVAIFAALTMFVFAKLAHHRHVVIKHQRRSDNSTNEKVLDSKSPYYIERDLADATPLTLLEEGCSPYDKDLVSSIQAEFDNKCAYMPDYMDVKIKKKGDMTSVDVYRRTASTQNGMISDGNHEVAPRRSLPVISDHRHEGDLQELKGEERREILKKLGPTFPHLDESLGLVRHCSLTFQKSKPTFLNSDELQGKPLKREVQSLTDLTQTNKKENTFDRRQMFENAQIQRNATPEDGCTYDVVDCHGSTLKKPQSSVELHIPRKAVPKNSTYTIKHQIHTDLKPFMKYINPHEEDIVGPVVEYSVINGYEFEKLVCIRVLHCVADANYLCDIRVQYSSDHMVYHDVEKQCKENNVRQKMFFVVDQEYVMIYTKHFTRYLCSCGKRPEVQMEVMLFASYSCLDEQEVALRVFICNVLYTIKDFKQALIDKEGSLPLRSTSVNLPNEGLSRDDQFLVKLMVKDGKWKPQTIEGNTVHELMQTKLAVDLYACHLGSYQVPVAAEFVLNPASEECLTFIRGVIEVTLKLAQRKPKKSKNPLSFLKKKPIEKTLENKCGNISVEPTKLWFAYDFSAQPFPSQFRESFMSLKSGNPDLMQTINYLADDLPIREFKPLARHLGLKELDFEQLEASYARDLREQKYKGLLLWQQREGYKATVETLTSALKTRELYEMYEHITGLVTESSDDDQVSVNFDIADNIAPASEKTDNRQVAQPSGKVPEIFADEINHKLLLKGLANDELSQAARDAILRQLYLSQQASEVNRGRVWCRPEYETEQTSRVSDVTVDCHATKNVQKGDDNSRYLSNILLNKERGDVTKGDDQLCRDNLNNVVINIDKEKSKKLIIDNGDLTDVTLDMSSEQSGLSLTDILGPSQSRDSSINKSDDKPSTIMVGNVLYSAETKRLMSPEERQWEGSDRFSTEYEPTFKSNQLNNIQYSHNNLTSTDASHVEQSIAHLPSENHTSSV